MFDLKGRNALVTGASGGIGRAIAKTLHEGGASVALAGTRTGKLEELALELGPRTAVITADLGEAEAPGAMLATMESQIGPPDIVINNAGLTRDSLALRMSDADWDKVLDINLSAAFRLARLALKGMMKRRWGRIVSITSVVGATGNAGQTNYAASKAGLTGMTKALAQEVASRGITVNCVAPGFIRTAMTDALDDTQQAAMMARIPAGRFGAVEDVAAAVRYLASEEAGYVTGATLHVNGGMAMLN